jgi:uncharacterized membrane protein
VTLIAIGTIVTFLHHGIYFSSPTSLSDIRAGRAAFPTTLSGVLHGIAQGQGRAIIAAGLLTLIATPILRVAVSIAIFAITGDRTFTAVTVAVLALLMISFLIGNATG